MASDWSSDQLGNLVQFKTGKLNSNAAVPNGRYPFFTCSQETFRTDTCAFDTECVLLAGNNANGIYPLKYFKGKFDAYQRTYVVTPLDSSKLSTRFLYFAMRPMLDYMRSISTGAATKFLTLTILKGLDFSYPPLPIQRKIASILSAYDDLIENNTRRIAILEEMAQAIYREWFVNFRFPGHENVKLVDSPLGQIPEGWEIVALGDLTNANRRITYGVVKPGDHDPNGVRFVRGGDVLAGQVHVNDLRTITTEVSDQYKRTLLQGGELLVSLVGNPGEVAIAPKELAGANIARQVGLVVIDDPLTTIYIKNFLMSSHGRNELFAHRTGSVQKVINLANLKMLRIICPPDMLLQRTMPGFEHIESQVLTLRKKNHNLRTTRDLLLSKLISGKLDVEDLDIDVGMTAQANTATLSNPCMAGIA